MSTRDDIRLAKRMMRLAKARGATGVVCSVATSSYEAVEVRDGRQEKFDTVLGRRDLALSVLVGKREAHIGTTRLDPCYLDVLVEKVVEMAKAATENPYAVMAGAELWPCDPSLLPEKEAVLELCDNSTPPSAKEMRALALDLEGRALSYPGVAKSAGASVSRSVGENILVTSEGFVAQNKRTRYSKGVSVIAVKGNEMNSGGDYHSARHFCDLRRNEICAALAGERAVMLLGGTPVPTEVMPVIFDSPVAARVLGWFFRGIGGSAVFFKSTFLADKKGEQVFPDDVTIVDDPHLPRMLGSQLYDDDCVRTARNELVSRGKLMMWVTSLESGMQLQIPSTGHAGGMSNLILLPGVRTREELVRSIERGFLVTGLLGHGPNMATGDLSSGAEGLLIENGTVTRPVAEVTVAGNLLDLWRTMQCASDTQEHGQVCTPSLLFDHMTVAGK